MKSYVVDLSVFIHYQTDKAYLVSDDGDRENAVWLPKSVVEIEPGMENSVGIPVGITLPEDLAIEKGLV